MPKKPTAAPAFRDVVAALVEPTRSRHSSAYLWLRQNRRHVERHIADYGINWQDFAAALATAGIFNRKGEPFSGAAVKQTWFRLGQDMLKQRLVRQGRPPVPAARGREIVRGILPVAHDLPATDEPPVAEEPPTRKSQFGGPATLRGHTTPPPPSKQPEPLPAAVVQDVDEVVARLLGKPRNKP